MEDENKSVDEIADELKDLEIEDDDIAFVQEQRQLDPSEIVSQIAEI